VKSGCTIFFCANGRMEIAGSSPEILPVSTAHLSNLKSPRKSRRSHQQHSHQEAKLPAQNFAAQPDQSLAGLRRSLISNGFCPIPVRGKRPIIKGWSALQPIDSDVESLIETYPDHTNTGLLTGRLVAIDIDILDLDVAMRFEELVTAMPGGERALRRVGLAPKSMFIFRTDEAHDKLATGEYAIGGRKCQIEVLGEGQQFVAFGTHPDTGRPYEWTTASPLDVRFDELPEIQPETILAFMEKAEGLLAEAGVPLKAPAKVRAASQSGTTFWQRVNTAALANTDAWVRELFSNATKEAGTGAWRVSSVSLGRALQEDISIHGDGIQDFGLEQSETPISLVEKYGGAPTPKAGAFWLCDRLGIDPGTVGWEERSLGVRMTLGAPKPAPVAANDDHDDGDEEPALIAPQSSGLPEALCYPPGAVGDFARFIVGCARFPSPHLALVASLAFTAGMVGRRYKGPTGLRSNLYVVGLAESGFGKDITIRASAALADSTAQGEKVSEWLFMDQIRSLPGLTNKLRKSPTAVIIQDEFGRFLADHTGRNVATHRAEITTALMELTGAPSGFWGGQEKAAGNIARIVQPCFTIHGVSTPSTFWNALSSGNISEGLLGRLVIIDVGNADPVKVRRPPNSIESIPTGLTEQVAGLLGLSAGIYTGPFFALNAKSDEKPFPIMTVEWGDGVDDLFEEFDDRIRAMKKTVDPQYRPILNRVGENAARLALIVAVGCDPKSPIITEEIQTWANSVAEHSLRVILKGASENISDNEKSAEYLRIRTIITRSGSAGLTAKGVVKAIRGALDRRRLEDILAMLRQAREVHLAKVVAASGQTKIRFWGEEFLPSDAEILTD
jgi:hypothetical protein